MTARPDAAPPIGEYTIQRWLFDTAVGRFDIDLGESGVQFQRFGDVQTDPDWELDYSLDRGAEETRQAIAALYGQADPQRVIVTHGAQEALYLFYRSFLRAGDHVITTTPGWQQAWEVPAHIGCRVNRLYWRPGSPFDLEALAAAIRPDTRLLILNSPGNPSGRTIDPDTWGSIIALADRHDLWIVNDEEYLIDFDDSVVNHYDRSVSVSSLSKVYGLPALRLGWAVTQPAVLEQMVNYKRYTTVSNSLVAERIAHAVLADRKRQLARYTALVTSGRDRLLSFADSRRDQLELVPPSGTPFAWFHLRTDEPAKAFAERLLVDYGVLVMPAEVFGAERGLRISYARPDGVLAEGLARVGRALDRIPAPPV